MTLVNITAVTVSLQYTKNDLIIGILSLCISAHPTVLLLLNPVLNLTFSLRLSSLDTHMLPSQIRPATVGAI